MKLWQIFEQEVDRTIAGVIMADSDDTKELELKEYVITVEVAKRLEDFLEAYLNYSGANGVWISGFFGSGKSHLLKMLAMLLENKPINDTTPLNIFLNKSPLKKEVIFASDLKRAVKIPSESILFNVDQKADVISKTELDALIAVFVKVFDEHCGYYGKQAYIAQFERELDADGLFNDFKLAFEVASGMPWEKGRGRAKRMSSKVDEAYNKISHDNTTGILDKYRTDYRLSIEDFAELVAEYVEQKEDGFRLNFLVDEIGQYIAGNIKLMTNLQTVAESLATKCKGRAWVIVTAQEDMSSVLGEVDQKTENDFTKIQARFKNRMKLTSQDVAEVIQGRLLDKKEEYKPLLLDLYQQQENNFRTLFDFANGSQTYKNYKDDKHFVKSYPFVPYQFGLFQSAIQGFSKHGAFEGKHSSVGERSMLGVFQDVAVAIKDHELGELATFDLMFEGIRKSLKTANQQSILKAENNLENKFAIRLLKALFLVKYVKEFKPTIRNICVLMHDSFNRDIPSLKKEIEEGLNLLETETYIQRNGEYFEYLTDEEQDIEREIKNTQVDNSVVASELEKLIFDGVIKTRKIRWSENNQDYSFSRKLDDNLTGREQELDINVITSFHEYPEAFEKHRTDTVYHDELRIVLPQSHRLVADLLLYKRTEKYVGHETKTTQQEGVKRILTEKGIQNRERLNQLKLLTSKLVGSAKYFVAGHELELSGEDGQTKIFRAFGDLIKHTYPNLNMLRDIQYNESDVASIISKAGQGLLGEDIQLPESQQEMMSFIQGNNRGGIRTTANSVFEKFEKKPYGWSYAAILCSLADLCAKGKVEVREATNLLDDNELAKALRNTGLHASLILEPQVDFSQSQVRAVKEFYSDYFEKVVSATEPKAIATEVKLAFEEQASKLEKFQFQSVQYPFLRVLEPIVTQLQALKKKPYTWFIAELLTQEEEFFDLKEQQINPITKFMQGSFKNIFDEAKLLLNEEKANLQYIEGDECQQINDLLVSESVYKSQSIQKLKAVTEALVVKVSAKTDEERKTALVTINELQDSFIGFDEFESLESTQQKLLSAVFEKAITNIESQQLIAMIRDEARRFEEITYANLIDQLMTLTQPIEPDDTSNNYTSPDESSDVQLKNSGDKASPTSKAVTKSPQSILAKQVKINYSRPWLANENDVNDYVDELRKALLKQIQDGKRIQL